MSDVPEPEPTAEPFTRIETHLEQALELCDDEETQYHLREALHLLMTPSDGHDQAATE